MLPSVNSLSTSEVLALAIAPEEDEARIYADFARRLNDAFPRTTEILEKMRDDESRHATRLIELHRARFGEPLPFIRRENVKGILRRPPIWLTLNLQVGQIHRMVETMEEEIVRFYRATACRTTDTTRRIFVLQVIHPGLAGLLVFLTGILIGSA